MYLEILTIVVYFVTVSDSMSGRLLQLPLPRTLQLSYHLGPHGLSAGRLNSLFLRRHVGMILLTANN